MKPRVITYLIVATLVNLSSFYYVRIFCGIYNSKSSGWFQGAIQSLLLDWCVFCIVLPILLFLSIMMARKLPKLM